eukprot:414317-Rhodomonas_salina.3
MPRLLPVRGCARGSVRAEVEDKVESKSRRLASGCVVRTMDGGESCEAQGMWGPVIVAPRHRVQSRVHAESMMSSVGQKE